MERVETFPTSGVQGIPQSDEDVLHGNRDIGNANFLKQKRSPGSNTVPTPAATPPPPGEDNRPTHLTY